MLPEPSFTVFKYNHADRVVPTWVIWAAWWGLLAVTVLSIRLLGELAIVPMVIAVAIIVKVWPKRCILLGARYLVCGNTVAYYKNIRKVALRPGNLTLFWGNKQSFKIEEARFPTNARKAHKITANKAAKFRKVADKIIQRVRAESPNVELVGVDRKALAEDTPP